MSILNMESAKSYRIGHYYYGAEESGREELQAEEEDVDGGDELSEY